MAARRTPKSFDLALVRVRVRIRVGVRVRLLGVTVLRFNRMPILSSRGGF